jgi:hypothetical protein
MSYQLVNHSESMQLYSILIPNIHVPLASAGPLPAQPTALTRFSESSLLQKVRGSISTVFKFMTPDYVTNWSQDLNFQTLDAVHAAQHGGRARAAEQAAWPIHASSEGQIANRYCETRVRTRELKDDEIETRAEILTSFPLWK